MAQLMSFIINCAIDSAVSDNNPFPYDNDVVY